MIALALLSLLVPVRSASQALFAASFALALISLGLWGRLFGRIALGVPRLGPWTAVYFGQFALLAAAAPVLALNRLAALALGRSLPLVALLAPATAALAAVRFRSFRPPARVDLLSLLGLGSVAVVVSIYSAHLSALGLDLHEHIFWIREIVARGFVPLDEGGTGIVGDYPRTFHLMAALWNAAGLDAPAGPFAKAMPFLQNALPALALAEQVVDVQAANAPEDRRKWEIALGLAFYVYVFLLVPMVYPMPDLSGTPRFSSGGLLLLPIVLAAIARAQHAPRASLFAIAAAPLLGAWALTWNPILVVFSLVVTLPLLVACWAAIRPPRLPGSGRALAGGWVASAGLAILVLAQDPWVAQLAAQRIPACRGLLKKADLVTFDEAVRKGLATAREKAVSEATADPPCRDARCLLRATGSAAADAVSVPWASLRAGGSGLVGLFSPSAPWLRDAFKDALPLRWAKVSDYAGIPYVSFVLAGALSWAWRRVRKQRDLQPDVAGALLLASLAGTTAAGMGIAFAAGMAQALSAQAHESVIVATYLGGGGGPVSIWLLWLPFLAAAVALAEPLIARAARTDPQALRSRPALTSAAAGLAIWLALPLAARLNLHLPRQHRGFWTRLGLEDLRALREIEAAIPPADGVIIPAEHANVANWEHWVLPLGETAALLPYGERRYLFNVYLGATYPLSWRDLEEGLCSEDPAARARFLQRTRARWVLVRDPEAPDAAAAIHRPRPRMCGVSFAALGAELPAVREQRGIYLFRLGGQPGGSDPPAP